MAKRGWTSGLMTGGLAAISLAGASLAGCEGSGGEVVGGSGGAGGGSASGSLEGVWEFFASDGDGISSGTVEIAADRLVFSVDDATFTYWEEAGTLAASYEDSRDAALLSVTRTATGFGTGDLLLPLGGSWSFTDALGGGSCAFTLEPGAFSSTCSGTNAPNWMLDMNTAVQGTRVRALSSRFGDLGGEWTLQDLGSGESCTLTFEGSSLTANCANSVRGGGFTLDFGANVASGTVQPSGEITAHRL